MRKEEIISIEQFGCVCEDDAVVRQYAEVHSQFFDKNGCVVGEVVGDKERVVGCGKSLKGDVGVGDELQGGVSVDAAINGNVEDGALRAVDGILHLGNDGQERVLDNVFVESVLPLEGKVVSVVLLKNRTRMDRGVLSSKKSENTVLLSLVVGVGEAKGCDVFKFLDIRLVDQKVLDTVLSWGEEFVASKSQRVRKGVSHLEGGIDEDARCAIEHFSEHSTHGRADDKVGMLLGNQVVEKIQCFCRMDGKVGRKNGVGGECLSKQFGGAGST